MTGIVETNVNACSRVHLTTVTLLYGIVKCYAGIYNIGMADQSYCVTNYILHINHTFERLSVLLYNTITAEDTR